MLLYRLGIRVYRLLIKIVALWNPKARSWVEGRRGQKPIWEKWKADNPGRLLIVHASSLGEYEQARSLITWWRQHHPSWKILVTFYSPSGYEYFSSEETDGHFYLPLDTKNKVNEFLEALSPDLFVFVRYDFWLELIDALHERQIPTAVISSFFRPDMWFLKPWARWALNRIKKLDAICTQNQKSVELLKEHGIQHAICTGDGRIDRVAQLAEQTKKFDWLEAFKGSKKLLIAGSPWEPDEDVLIPFIRKNPEVKVLIAPHEIVKPHVDRMIKKLDGLSYWRWTDLTADEDLETRQILVLDAIGYLSSTYRYGELALIGGGFTTGIHSIQEPAAYGCPPIFGPKHSGFPEATTLMELKGGWEIKNASEFDEVATLLLENEKTLKEASRVCKEFIQENVGASDRTGLKLQELIR